MTDGPSDITFQDETEEEKGDDYEESLSIGHEDYSHYHRYNSKAPEGRVGNVVRYLDHKGNPVPKGHNDSHIYP